MSKQGRLGQGSAHRYMLELLTNPSTFTFVPAFCLAAFWFGGEGALMVLAALIPIIYLAISNIVRRHRQQQLGPGDALPPARFERKTEEYRKRASQQNSKSALFLIEIDEFDALAEQYGQSAADVISERIGQQISHVVRQADSFGNLSDARFGICTAPMKQLDLELCLQMAARLQTRVEEPISIDGMVVYVTASIGFCQLSRAPAETTADWMDAARTALNEARRNGPATIRAYSKQMHKEAAAREETREGVLQALELGQLRPWFQPQISTDTGEITGFEALVRWMHPQRGILAPHEFLPAITKAGLHERLAEVMMYHAFAALRAWDSAGVVIPQIGVNFAGPELNNPRLVEKIEWELDRFDLTPDRLTVEVLETVVAGGPDDMITRNIMALRKLGCRIDLDDFGTGHASIASIRRFSVNRIKIDRSFVTKADRDPEQQRMISAILTMAERLNVETLAEGVETVGEHVLLSQLGCDHVQGFGIARPMPFEQTLDWVAAHSAKLEKVPRIMDGKTR